MSASANPASALEPVILGPEMTAQHVAGLLLTGRTDLDAVTAWSLDCTVNLKDPAEYAALNNMLTSADMNKVFIATLEKENKKTRKDAAVRISFSEPGRAVLNNSIKMNQSADGRGGVSLSLFPRELSQLIDHLPVLVASVIDNADVKVKADAVKTIEDDETKAARKAAGLKFSKSDATTVKHKRAGLDCMDWTGCDKVATLAKLRVWLDRFPKASPVK
jgi:hypothetical protein